MHEWRGHPMIARNAPCPCGSGKKYKLCCIPPAPHALQPESSGSGSVDFGTADRTSAFTKLLAFMQRTKLVTKGNDLAAAFCGGHDAWDDLGETAFATWLAYDRAFGPATACERFLAASHQRLTAGERRYLERMRDSRMRLVEIEEVRLDQGFTLRDVATEERFNVRERMMTMQVYRYDIVAARVMTASEAAFEFDGAVYLFSQDDVTPLIEAIATAERTQSAKSAAATAIHRYYVETVVLRPPPKVTTSEGQEIAPSRVVFAADPAAFERLSQDRRFVGTGNGSLTWKASARSSRILGSVTYDDEFVTLKTLSLERADKGRRLLSKLLAPSGRFVRMKTESLEDSLAGSTPRGSESDGEDAIASAIQLQVIDAYYRQHYGSWPDEPLPALDGATPRAAAKNAKTRERVVALLKSIDADLARQRADGKISYDVDWMWNDLGLESRRRSPSRPRSTRDHPRTGPKTES